MFSISWVDRNKDLILVHESQGYKPCEKMKRPRHQVDPADWADVRCPDESVATLELLNLRPDRLRGPDD